MLKAWFDLYHHTLVSVSHRILLRSQKPGLSHQLLSHQNQVDLVYKRHAGETEVVYLEKILVQSEQSLSIHHNAPLYSSVVFNHGAVSMQKQRGKPEPGKCTSVWHFSICFRLKMLYSTLKNYSPIHILIHKHQYMQTVEISRLKCFAEEQ